MKLKLKIINLDGVYLEKEVDLLCIMTSAGELTILAQHQPIITNISISVMYTKEEGVITKYAIAGGTLFVTENECKVITSAIESEDQIDFQRAENAKTRALKRMERKEDSNIDMLRAEVALKRAINRLSVNK